MLPEHVTDEIRRPEVVEQRSALEPLKREAIGVFPFAVGQVRLVEEFLFVEDTFLQRVVIFRNPECVEPSRIRGDVRDEVRRRADGRRGFRGVQIHGRDIDLGFRVDLLDIQADHSACFGCESNRREAFAGRHLEGEGNGKPLTPFADLEQQNVLLERHAEEVSLWVPNELEGNFRYFGKRLLVIRPEQFVWWPDKRDGCLVIAAPQVGVHEPASRYATAFERCPGRDVGELAESAGQVGSPHAADAAMETELFIILRWVVRGQKVNLACVSMLAELTPERRASAEQLDLPGCPERNPPLPEFNGSRVVFADDPGSREVRFNRQGAVRRGVAMNKVEDLVHSGVGAGDNVGERHGRLRGIAGGERGEPSHGFQSGQIGEPSGLDQSVNQMGIHAVERQDHGSRPALSLGSVPAPPTAGCHG